MTFVDSNVRFDVLTDAPVWADWSQAQLDRAAASGPIVINDVVFAEISVRYAAVDDVTEVLESTQIERAAIPPAALFLAGKAYARYRKSGGLRTGVLPDFFIGAHAAIARQPLLTRDTRRYRHYFPTLELIAPNQY